MTWLAGALAWIVGYIVIHILGEAVLEFVFTPLFSPLRSLYRPPHGRWVLLATWLAALTGTAGSVLILDTAFGTAAFIACIPLAMLASATHRHELKAQSEDLVLPDRSRGP